MSGKGEGMKAEIREVLPKSGLVYSERGGLTEILCKPKILPLKSVVLEQLQKIEKADDEDEGKGYDGKSME
jgi:BBSome-interacting protein 1